MGNTRRERLHGENYDTFVDKQRAVSAKDDIFRFEENSLEPNDVETVKKDNGPVYKKSRTLSDQEFEDYKSEAKNSGLEFSQRPKGWRVTDDKLDSLGIPDPREVSASRSESTVEADRNRRASLTKDVEKYSNDPERFDYPLVDTPNEFEENIVDNQPFPELMDVGDTLNQNPADKLEDLFF